MFYIDKYNAGFLHKLDDFLKAAELAVRSDRTLVSYTPAISAIHMRNKNKEPVKISNGKQFPHGWTWADLIDTDQFLYSTRIGRVSNYCL